MRKPLMLVALALSLSALTLEAQTPAKVYGAATPQEVMAAMDKAIKADDFAAAVPLISPEGRKMLATDGIMGLMIGINFSNPDDPMGAKETNKTVLAKKQKDYKAAVELAKQTLKPYGMDALIGKPPMSEASSKAIEAGLAKADTVALMTSLIATVEKMGPLLGMTKKPGPSIPFKFGPVSGYKITGDKATAKAGTEPLDFVKLDGRWYLTPPTPKEK